MKSILLLCAMTLALICIANTLPIAPDAQRAWEVRQYDASTNIIAKVTSLENPLNSKGQMIEQDILTYYRYGKMRYATNVFDRLN